VKVFTCQSCQQLLFFESVQCVRCGHALAYLPDRGLVSAIEPEPASGPAPSSTSTSTFAAAPEPTPASSKPAAPSNSPAPAAPPVKLWRALDPASREGGSTYRLCRNYVEHAVCNWAIPSAESDEYCRSCRLNHVIPALDDAQAKEAWHRLEIAKRRLLYTLMGLGLPVETKAENPAGGLAFDFLQQSADPNAPRVFTGHNDGIVTINIAEADDPFREKMRVQMGEAYRTVLGHFRHEIGHYYWERLLKDDSERLQAFRARFGDERADYDVAREHHYKEGAPADWPNRHVSSYASMHPWEDWAETWAHTLHIVDTLETARAYGLSLQPPAPTGGPGAGAVATRQIDRHAFDDLMAGWIPLTQALNSLNRSMGTNDFYPFVLSEVVIEKLRFVQVVETAARGPVPPDPSP
jgi:hypothetical protein